MNMIPILTSILLFVLPAASFAAIAGAPVPAGNIGAGVPSTTIPGGMNVGTGLNGAGTANPTVYSAPVTGVNTLGNTQSASGYGNTQATGYNRPTVETGTNGRIVDPNIGNPNQNGIGNTGTMDNGTNNSGNIQEGSTSTGSGM